MYVIITAALGLFWGAFSSVDRYIQQLMSFKVGAIVGDLMYERFLALEFWRYDDKETVDLYDRAKRFSDSYARVLDRIAAIFTQLVSVILAVGALLLVSWWIAVIVLVAIVPERLPAVQTFPGADRALEHPGGFAPPAPDDRDQPAAPAAHRRDAPVRDRGLPDGLPVPAAGR